MTCLTSLFFFFFRILNSLFHFSPLYFTYLKKTVIYPFQFLLILFQIKLQRCKSYIISEVDEIANMLWQLNVSDTRIRIGIKVQFPLALESELTLGMDSNLESELIRIY